MLDTDRTDAIDDLVYDWLAETGAPGASLVVTDGTTEQYATGIGSRDLDSNAPTTPDTLYGVASVTKSFTTLAVLQQVERDALSLEDPITQHTPVEFEGAPEITIEDLLTHSSGLPNLGTSEVLLARLADLGETGVPLADRDDLYQFLGEAGGERDEHSRGRFQYNNTAYTLLSHAVEATADRTYDEYVEAEILAPLGMERSTFDAEAFEADEDHATPHRSVDEGFEATRFPSRRLSRAPGGLISSPRELGQYLRFNLQGGELDGERLVNGALLDRAHESHIEPLPRYGEGYGYGWMRRTVADTVVVGHGGSLLTSSSAIGVLPERDLGIALCCASQPEIHPTAVLDGIVAILQGAGPEQVVPELGYRSRVEALTGRYESYRGIVSATVTEEGGYLSVEIAMGPLEEEYVLVPDDPALAGTDGSAGKTWTFTAPQSGRPMPVEFVDTGDGIDLFFDRYRLHGQSESAMGSASYDP